jgi:hypothetical protein
VSACRRRKVVYAPSLWNCCRRRWPPFHRRTLSVLRMVGDECRAHEICALHLDAIAARAGVRCKRTTMSHAFRATVMIAAAAGALSEMVGERLTCRASISMPRPIRYKMEKNWAQLGRGEVRRRHQGPNRSQRRKSIWVFDRAHSTDLQKPARPIHRLSRTGWALPQIDSAWRSHPEGAEFNSGTARLVATEPPLQSANDDSHRSLPQCPRPIIRLATITAHTCDACHR